MSKEAMKLALEALELNNDEWKSLADSGDSGYWKAEDQDHYQQTNKAITALREALAEQPAQQEPVATLWQHGETGRTRITMPGDITDCDARWFKAADLYTSPQPAQQEYERGFIDGMQEQMKRSVDRAVNAMAQRTWVGLTDGEWMNIVNKDHAWFGQRPEDVAHEVAKLVETKLKEKNT